MEDETSEKITKKISNEQSSDFPEIDWETIAKESSKPPKIRNKGKGGNGRRPRRQDTQKTGAFNFGNETNWGSSNSDGNWGNVDLEFERSLLSEEIGRDTGNPWLNVGSDNGGLFGSSSTSNTSFGSFGSSGNNWGGFSTDESWGTGSSGAANFTGSSEEVRKLFEDASNVGGNPSLSLLSSFSLSPFSLCPRRSELQKKTGVSSTAGWTTQPNFFSANENASTSIWGNQNESGSSGQRDVTFNSRVETGDTRAFGGFRNFGLGAIEEEKISGWTFEPLGYNSSSQPQMGKTVEEMGEMKEGFDFSGNNEKEERYILEGNIFIKGFTMAMYEEQRMEEREKIMEVHRVVYDLEMVEFCFLCVRVVLSVLGVHKYL